MGPRALSRLTGRHLLLTAAAVVLLLTLARAAVFWPRQTYVDTVSGVWIGLAVDVAHGVLYRPVVGPDGYGGTRYLPLHFLLHGGLITAGVPAIAAGLVMSAASVALVLLGLVLLLRQETTSTALAIAAAALVLASQVLQQALLSVRADGLATGLALLGLALCSRGGRRAVVLGFVCFALSWTTKLTSVAGGATALAWLLWQRRYRDAAAGVVTATVTAAVVLGVVAVASDGRLFSAIGGGVGSGLSVGALLRAPLTLMRIARETPETLIFLQLGAALWIVSLTRGRVASLPALYWIVAMVAAVPNFAAIGADINHLVEPTAASCLLIATFAIAAVDRVSVAAAVFVVGALAGASSLASGLLDRRNEQRWGAPIEAVRMVGDRSRPILSENPAVPVAADRRPYVLDPFIFRLIADRTPGFADQLRDAVARREFAAVVLERDPHSDRGREWYRWFFFDGFIDLVEAHYREAGRSRMRIIYTPK